MLTCVQLQLQRHFGQYETVNGSLSAAVEIADADGSGEIEGSEAVHVIHSFMSHMVLGSDSRVLRVILRLAWCT